MGNFLLAVIFFAVLAVSATLQKVFLRLPPVELKRRARRGDEMARKLYKLAAAGQNLRLALWILVVIAAALVFIFLAESLAFWPALLIIIAVIWFGFIWLPGSRVYDFEISLASVLASPLSAFLRWAARPLGSFARLRRGAVHAHTGLFEKPDLLDMLESQKAQHDNRIDQEAIDIAINGLTFGDKIVEDYMTPRSAVHTVSAAEEVSPKMIDELHKSGQQLFPVIESKPERIIGSLRLSDLIDLKKSGLVRSFMKPKVYYIHEDHSLAQVLDAFYKTRNHLFIVVNKFEDFVGVITIEEVLEQIIGKPILSDFDDYDNAEAVAKHVARISAGNEFQEEDLVAEVVEPEPSVVK